MGLSFAHDRVIARANLVVELQETIDDRARVHTIDASFAFNDFLRFQPFGVSALAAGYLQFMSALMYFHECTHETTQTCTRRACATQGSDADAHRQGSARTVSVARFCGDHDQVDCQESRDCRG